jgi:hypothetical protein
MVLSLLFAVLASVANGTASVLQRKGVSRERGRGQALRSVPHGVRE